MAQIIEALTNTAVRLGEQYGPMVAIGVLACVAFGVVLRVLALRAQSK